MSKVIFPTSIEQLRDARSEPPSSVVMAGGTDLLTARRNRLLDPEVIISLERIEELKQIYTTNEDVIIGAMVTHQQLLDSPVIAKYLPILREGAATLGSPAIRHMATIGGNICTASPAADTLPPLYVLKARLELVSQAGNRTIPINEFISGPGQTHLCSSEFLAAIRIPLPSPIPKVNTYFKVGLRQALAISICNMAAVVHTAPSGTVIDARIAWGSVGPTVMRFPELEESLRGQQLAVSLLRDLGQKAALKVSPISDIRASAEYRRMLAANLPLRLLNYL